MNIGKAIQVSAIEKLGQLQSAEMEERPPLPSINENANILNIDVYLGIENKREVDYHSF